MDSPASFKAYFLRPCFLLSAFVLIKFNLKILSNIKCLDLLSHLADPQDTFTVLEQWLLTPPEYGVIAQKLFCWPGLDQRRCQQKTAPITPSYLNIYPTLKHTLVCRHIYWQIFSPPHKAPNFLPLAKGPGHVFRISLLAFTSLHGKSQQDRDCALFNYESLKHSILASKKSWRKSAVKWMAHTSHSESRS